MNRKSFSAIILGLVACALHATVVVDGTTKLPLAKASVYGKKENALGLTDESGRVPSVGERNYPLTVRYIGYAPEEVTSERVDTVMMIPVSYDLPELTVGKKNQSQLHVVAFCRSYMTTTYESDTIVGFTESILDYSLKDKDLDKPQKAKDRVLEQKSYMYMRTRERGDSVSSRPDVISALPFNTLPEVRELPAELFEGEGEFAVWTDKPVKFTDRWLKRGSEFEFSRDALASQKDHAFSPFLFKMLGLDATLNTIYKVEKYSSLQGRKTGLESLAFMSTLVTMDGKGPLCRKMYKTSAPVTWSIYTEVYVLNHEFLTKEEYRDYRVTPEVRERIQSTVPELSPEMKRIKAKVEAKEEERERTK